MEHPTFKRIRKSLLLPGHLRVYLMLMQNILLTLHLLYPHHTHFFGVEVFWGFFWFKVFFGFFSGLKFFLLFFGVKVFVFKGWSKFFLLFFENFLLGLGIGTNGLGIGTVLKRDFWGWHPLTHEGEPLTPLFPLLLG